MLRPVVIALFALGLARADGLILRGTAINASRLMLAPDLTLGSPGEAMSVLVPGRASSIAGTVTLQFKATGAHNKLSFPDGTWYEYSGGSFSIAGSLNGAPSRVLVSGSILKGQGGTENASGKFGPVLYVFYATQLKPAYVDPALGSQGDPVTFRIVQTFAKSRGPGGRVSFDGSKTISETQVFGLKGPRPR